MAICGLSTRKYFFPAGPDDSIPGQVVLAEKVSRAVADAARLGLEKQVAQSVAEYLYGHHF
jgi:hypothetical protein